MSDFIPPQICANVPGTWAYETMVHRILYGNVCAFCWRRDNPVQIDDGADAVEGVNQNINVELILCYCQIYFPE